MISSTPELLQQHGISPTPQRVAVYGALRGRTDHPDVDAVFEKLRDALPTLSRTTVYSTMQIFARKGLVREVHAEDGTLRYDPDTRFHAHFKCRDCGGLFDIGLPDCHDHPFASLPAGFVHDGEELVYYGRCPQCSSASAPDLRDTP